MELAKQSEKVAERAVSSGKSASAEDVCPVLTAPPSPARLSAGFVVNPLQCSRSGEAEVKRIQEQNERFDRAVNAGSAAFEREYGKKRETVRMRIQSSLIFKKITPTRKILVKNENVASGFE